MHRIKMGIIGAPGDTHFERRLSKIEPNKYDITLISPVYYEGMTFQQYPVFSVNLKDFKFLRHFRYFFQYYKFMTQSNFEIIYCFGALSSLAWLAGLCSKDKLVITTIGSDVFLEEQVEISSGVRKNINNCLKSANRITILTKPMEKKLQKDTGVEAQYIYNDFLDIEDEWFFKRAEKKKYCLGYPNILSPRILAPLYQQESIIKGIHLLKETFPQVKLFQTTFRADPNYLKKCQELIEKLDLHDNVEFIDPLAHPLDLLPYYDSSELVIMLPKSDAIAASMFEAWAREKPVIVSNIYNYSDEDNEQLFLKTESDPLSITNSIIRLTHEKSLRENMIKQSSRYIEIQRTNHSTLRIFDNLPEQKKRNLYFRFKGIYLFLYFLLEPHCLRIKKYLKLKLLYSKLFSINFSVRKDL